MKQKTAWITSLLNLLLPGLGYAYIGYPVLAAILYAVFIVLVGSFRFTAYSFLIFVTTLSIALVYWLGIQIYGIILTHRQQGKAWRFDKWYVYVGLILLNHLCMEVMRTDLPALNAATPINTVIIPTPSMLPTLQVNDLLVMERTIKVKRNELVVFEPPGYENTWFIFRCVGLPDEEIEVQDGLVYSNGELIDVPDERKFAYEVSTKNKSVLSDRFLKKHVGTTESPEFYQKSRGVYRLNLTLKEKAGLLKNDLIERVVPAENYATELFPKSFSNEWSINQYGRLWIPKKGVSIPLTPENVMRYGITIMSENATISLGIDHILYSASKKLDSYTFQKNYYFVMGDNRDNALDSRVLGFIPEEALVGKLLYIFWAEDKSRISMSFQE